MIKRIRIHGYKSFQNLDLSLEPISVIFGPNASGKSNLLDAIALLSRMVTSNSSLNDAFTGHRGDPLESFFYADEGYEGLQQKDSARFSIEVDVETSEAVRSDVEKTIADIRKGLDVERRIRTVKFEKYLRYRIEVEIAPATGYLRVRDERLVALRKDGEERSRATRPPFIEGQGDRIVLRREGQAGPPTLYEVGLDYTLVSRPLYVPHYAHITALRSELESWSGYYLEPKALMRKEVPRKEVRRLGPSGENLAAFLNVLKHENPRAYETFHLTLRQVLPAATSVEVELLKEGLLSLRLSENGATYSARLVSEGTLRILGLLVALHPSNSATVVAFEEPENGVHPVRLKLIAELLKNSAMQGKQIIVTTHSPRFPGFFDNRNLFVCRKEAGITKIEPFTSWGALWRRPEIESALEDMIERGDFGG